MKYLSLLGNYVYTKMFTGIWEILPTIYLKCWVSVWYMRKLWGGGGKERKKNIAKGYTECSFIIIHCRNRMKEKHRNIRRRDERRIAKEARLLTELCDLSVFLSNRCPP